MRQNPWQTLVAISCRLVELKHPIVLRISHQALGILVSMYCHALPALYKTDMLLAFQRFFVLVFLDGNLGQFKYILHLQSSEHFDCDYYDQCVTLHSSSIM